MSSSLKVPLSKSFNNHSLRIDIDFIEMSHSDEAKNKVVRKTASSNFKAIKGA